MKKLVAIILVLSFALTLPALMQQASAKGASSTAMEKASDEAVFHRVGDWFATRGKTGAEKDAILAERKAQRAAKRAQKEMEKQQKIAAKEAKRAQKEMDKQMKGMKKELGKK